MALSKKDKQGVALIAGGVVVVAVLFGIKISAGGDKKSNEFGCTEPVQANTVIVIDHSEEIPEQTRKEITERALRYVEKNSDVNERISVFKISEVSKKSLTPSFSMCKPKRDGNRLTEGVALLEKKYKKNFHDPLVKALNAEPNNAKESPLAQALIDISLTQYLRGDKNSILIFSDMLEHVPGKFSMYAPQACGSKEETIAMFRDSRKGATERPHFINTAVTLNIVPRTDVPRHALACRDQFWPWFFGDNEGVNAGLKPDFLPGL